MKLKNKGKPGEIIRKIIIETLEKEKRKVIEKLREIGKLEVIKEKKSKKSVAELIREDRDVLH